ncbi:MAG TPA: hypothetical protein VMN38_04175 [Sphingomicrobium sp.]|nr:hypothetical protein [Sphingomicrobium sp.]
MPQDISHYLNFAKPALDLTADARAGRWMSCSPSVIEAPALFIGSSAQSLPFVRPFRRLGSGTTISRSISFISRSTSLHQRKSNVVERRKRKFTVGGVAFGHQLLPFSQFFWR